MKMIPRRAWQGEFGSTPFAAPGGGSHVRDEIPADFLIVGHKSGGAM